MEAGPHVTQELAASKLAATVDLIVHLDMKTTTNGSGSQRHRRVAEIIAVAPGERETGYATTHVFESDPTGVATPAVLPDDYRGLTAHGFDLAGFLASQGVRS
jgi:pilus assembly protein CpaF